VSRLHLTIGICMRTSSYFMPFLCLGAAFSHSARADLLKDSFGAAYYFADASTSYALSTFMPQDFVAGPAPESISEVENATSLLTDLSENSDTIPFHSVLSNPTWAIAPLNGMIFTQTTGSPLQIRFSDATPLQPWLPLPELDMSTLAAGAAVIAWVRLRRRFRV
jgi:hypothetical protein